MVSSMDMDKTSWNFYKNKKMTLSISVMAHPSRAKYFSYLNGKLDGPRFSIDEGWGLIENNRRAWKMYDPKADFHTVIQDDAIVCDHFKERAIDILASTDWAYNFYFGNRENLKSTAIQGMRMGHIIGEMRWGLAICLPTKLISEMLEFCAKMKSRHDDTNIAKFLKHKKIKTFYPMPSLIDHRADEKSLVGDKGTGRKAWYFIDNENK
jgi:hypothetical protein